MFGPVVTTEAHLAYAGARIHANNTAEMSAIIEALSFLGPRGPVACDACSCVFYDSKHVAGVCLGTIHARTHVQLGLSCQQLLLKVQRRLRFTMPHVYSHAENLGNECAYHAAALGCRTMTFPHVGRVVMSWKNYVTSKRRMCLPPCARPGVNVLFHAVLRCGLSCLYHRPLWSILVHSLGSIFYGSQIVRCGAPLRILLTSMRMHLESHDGAAISRADWQHLRNLRGGK